MACLNEPQSAAVDMAQTSQLRMATYVAYPLWWNAAAAHVILPNASSL